MKVIEKKPVPVYQVKRYECGSIIQYTAAEVHYGQIIYCPVCKVSLWASTNHHACYETDEETLEGLGE